MSFGINIITTFFIVYCDDFFNGARELEILMARGRLILTELSWQQNTLLLKFCHKMQTSIS